MNVIRTLFQNINLYLFHTEITMNVKNDDPATIKSYIIVRKQ